MRLVSLPEEGTRVTAAAWSEAAVSPLPGWPLRRLGEARQGCTQTFAWEGARPCRAQSGLRMVESRCLYLAAPPSVALCPRSPAAPSAAPSSLPKPGAVWGDAPGLTGPSAPRRTQPSPPWGSGLGGQGPAVATACGGFIPLVARAPPSLPPAPASPPTGWDDTPSLAGISAQNPQGLLGVRPSFLGPSRWALTPLCD